MARILVTGGTGYIGAHTVVLLLQAGHELTLLDNLSNSDVGVLDRIETISGRRPHFVQGDVRDAALLKRLFAEQRFDSVIHFAGLKAVGDSVRFPLAYFDNNVNGSLQLLMAMREADVKTFVFSSSATVYGDPAAVPIREDFPRSAVNPYGGSKLMVEDILEDLHSSDPSWRIARLRYFNPVGAHESGLIGEAPRGVPTNLMPFVCQVAAGHRERLNIFGGDYATRDSTAIRDYIHVMDLAAGHQAALAYLERNPGLLTVNLGTGKGYSVLEVVTAFEEASGTRVPYEIVGRRSGDVAECWADPQKAQDLFGWRAQKTLDVMCQDAWRWQNNSTDSRQV